MPEASFVARWWRTRDVRAVLILLGVFVISRAAIVAAGLHFDLEWEGLSIQNIDVRLLQHRLLESLWYMHGQPPLWNALVGLSMKLGNSFYPVAWHLVFIGLGFLTTLALYALLREVRIPIPAAIVVTALFTLNPETLLFENAFFYDYPTTALLTLSALAVAHYAARPSLGRGLVVFALAAALILLRTLFQWPWLVLVAAVLLVSRSRARTVLAAGSVAVALVAGVVAKNWVMYGVPSTTSWTGIMLARSTVDSLPLSERRRLVAEGKLHVVSLVEPQSALSAYEAVGVEPDRPTGIPLLDDRGDAFFPRNLENRAYIRISKQYLDDDLWVLEHRTHAYLRYVGHGIADYFAPATLDPTENRRELDPYVRWFDRVVFGRLGQGRDGVFLIGLCLVAFVSGVWITARELRPDADVTVVLVAFCTLALVYVTATGTLAEVGENYRFRFVLEPLTLVLASAGVQRVVRRLRRAGVSSPRSARGD